MKKENKKNKKTESKTEKKDLKKILKKVSLEEKGTSLPIGESQSKETSQKKEEIIQPIAEEIPIEDFFAQEKIRLAPEDLILQQNEELPFQVLEETIKEEYPEEISSNNLYSGPKETISYESTSTAYNPTNSDLYSETGGEGYTSNQEQGQNSPYDATDSFYEPGSSNKDEKVGEIRDTSSSALESKFIKMAKGQKKNNFQSQRY